MHESSPPTNCGFVYLDCIPRVPPGTTVLSYLTGRYPHSTEDAWRERIETGRVTLNGSRTDPDREVSEGMNVAWARPPWVEPEAPLHYDLLHEDSQVLAVGKPAGLPTLPGAGFLDHTLASLVRRDFPDATPGHRLGRWTSGVVLFARGREARSVLAEAFRSGEARKRYRALASGNPERSRWTMETPIGPVPHPLLGTVHAASGTGRPSRSTVTVRERRNGSFLADVSIDTGRPHQIRIHLAASGHPLVGDPLYPPGGVPDAACAALPGDRGYHLHAAEIRVPHPAGGELRVVSEPPEELRPEGG